MIFVLLAAMLALLAFFLFVATASALWAWLSLALTALGIALLVWDIRRKR